MTKHLSKRTNIMKKTLSIIITVAVLLSALTISIYAINLSLTTTRITVNGNSMLVSNNTFEEAVHITAEEAGHIAELFIADMTASETCCWNKDTEIVDIVTLYNETETVATAHTVVLSEGYVLVSAFADAEVLVPEWSDTATPVYENLEYDNDDRIVYLGAYEYYIDSSTTTVTDLYGNEVNKTELVNYVEESRDISNMSPALIESCVVTPGDLTMSYTADSPLPIEDPFEHASDTYGGTFYCTEYYNEWGTYLDSNYNFYDSTQAALGCNQTYYNCCGPIAITNIVLAYKKRYQDSSIPSRSSVFQTIADYGATHTKTFDSSNDVDRTAYYYVNDPDPDIGGTSSSRAPYYIMDSLDMYNIQTSVSGRTLTKFEYVSLSLRSGCLLYLSTFNHELYDNHAVMCYAYTRLRSNVTGYYKTYLKVADGWDNAPRYIDLLTVQADIFSDYSICSYISVGPW